MLLFLKGTETKSTAPSPYPLPKGEGIREGEHSPLHPPEGGCNAACDAALSHFPLHPLGEGVTLPVTPLCHISLSTPWGERVRVRGPQGFCIIWRTA